MASYRAKSNPYSENSALFRYAYIDKNSDLHILFPVSGGEVIGNDNTCQSTKKLKFFIQYTGNFYDPIYQL